MDEEGKDDFEIGDVESFSSGKDIQYSHSGLVMSVMRKCLDAGCEEMKAGYWQQRLDKQGNTISTYIEDTRRKFISSVMTACGFMKCDFDDDATDKINELRKKIEDKKNELAEENNKIWETMPMEQRRKNPHVKGFITLPFLQDLMTEFQLDTYREIFEELNLLTKRIDFYKEEMFEA